MEAIEKIARLISLSSIRFAAPNGFKFLVDENPFICFVHLLRDAATPFDFRALECPRMPHTASRDRVLFPLPYIIN